MNTNADKGAAVAQEQLSKVLGQNPLFDAVYKKRAKTLREHASAIITAGDEQREKVVEAADAAAKRIAVRYLSYSGKAYGG